MHDQGKTRRGWDGSYVALRDLETALAKYDLTGGPCVVYSIFNIQYYARALCAMHTRTDCPMQHYAEVKVKISIQIF